MQKTSGGKGEGRLSGDFKVTIDRDQPGRTIASGTLKGRQIDLRRLIRIPLVMEQMDLDADGTRVRMRPAILRWAEQEATIRGELRPGPGGALDSDAMGLVANGTVGLRDERSDLTVLVAPFGSLDRLVRRVPVFGYVIGGALTSIPVGVSGSLRDPLVLPLGQEAVTSQLVGIFERILKLPGKLLPSAKDGSTPAASTR